MNVKLKRLDPNARLPTQGSLEAACWDLYANDAGVYKGLTYLEYDLGIALEIPKGYVGYLRARSSICDKGLTLCNGVGVIDSDYRGSLRVRFYYREAHEKYRAGDRIAQIEFKPVYEVTWSLADDLGDTQRGVGGFGSSGQ